MRDQLETQEARARLASLGVLFERLLHDLKQPLNSIRITAQDLRIDVSKDRFEIDSLPSGMRKIEQLVDHLVFQIDQLRAFAIPKKDRGFDAKADANAICDRAVERVRAARAGAVISEVLNPGLPLLAVDPAGLQQAVCELLDNAVHAAEHLSRPPAVEIATYQRDQTVVIAVKDNGCGVPTDLRTKIFEPFFTTHSGAAGLGLSLALAFAESAHGQLALRHSDPEGSLFELSLPLHPEKLVQDRPTEPRA